MSVTRVKPEGLYPAHGFAHGTIATGSRIISIGGQIASDLDGVVRAVGDYRTQGEVALRNVGAVLEAAGATPADLASLTVFIVDLNSDRQDEVFAGYGTAASELGIRSTAFTVIGVSALAHEGALVEITGTAVL